MRTALLRTAVLAMTTAIALGAGGTAFAKPMPATPYRYITMSCTSKKGDKGWFRFKVRRSSTYTVYATDTKIKLANGKRTKHNNAEVKHQHGAYIISADNMVADNKWHSFWDLGNKHGRRGKVTIKFTFDYPKTSDPGCSKTQVW